MYAIVSLQGQQFRVEPGAVIDVNRMSAGEGEKVTVSDSVLLSMNSCLLVTVSHKGFVVATSQVSVVPLGDEPVVFHEETSYFQSMTRRSGSG